MLTLKLLLRGGWITKTAAMHLFTLCYLFFCWIYHLKLVNRWMAKWYCFLLQVTWFILIKPKRKMTFQLLIALWIPLLTYLALEEKLKLYFIPLCQKYIHSFFIPPKHVFQVERILFGLKWAQISSWAKMKT